MLAQGFSGAKYFHPRPSDAGTGYDPTNSGGSNLGPTSQKLMDGIKANVAHKRHRLISKPQKMKRKARGTVTLRPGDTNLVLTYMPYLRG